MTQRYLDVGRWYYFIFSLLSILFQTRIATNINRHVPLLDFDRWHAYTIFTISINATFAVFFMSVINYFRLPEKPNSYYCYYFERFRMKSRRIVRFSNVFNIFSWRLKCLSTAGRPGIKVEIIVDDYDQFHKVFNQIEYSFSLLFAILN